MNLSGEGLHRSTTTVKGRYAFTGLPAGSYGLWVTMPGDLPPAVSARVPEDMEPLSRFRDGYEPALVRAATIPNLHACRHAPFIAEFGGSISGHVLDAGGSPAEGIAVEVVPASVNTRTQRFDGMTATTDDAGRYRIGGLMAGGYIVGVNLRDVVTGDMPYPAVEHRDAAGGGPGIVTLAANERTDLPPLRLPAAVPIRKIRGSVKMADGSPLDDVWLQIREADREYGSSNRSGGGHSATSTSVWLDVDPASGTFSGQAYEGRSYIIRAFVDGPHGQSPEGPEDPSVASATMTVTIRGNMDGLQLVLAPGQPQ